MPEIYLTITIDVEPDCSPSWHYSDPLQFKGVTEGIGEILGPLFKRNSITPTYLINNVVLEDETSVSFFRSLGKEAELGTHLHPEFIGPQKEFSNYAGKKGEANCCFYPPEIERGKLISITELFTKQFGYSPASFRAGRFSAGKNTIAVLRELNYKVDTSVTPGIKWNDKTREGIVDYENAMDQPYWTDQFSFPGSSSSGLLQVPVTIINEPAYSAKRILRFLRTGNKQSFKNIQWLRPKFSDLATLKKIVRTVTGNYAANDIVVLNMMFHNVEVIPGLSPYVNSKQQAQTYLSDLENFCRFCNEQNIKSVPLSFLYDRYQGK